MFALIPADLIAVLKIINGSASDDKNKTITVTEIFERYILKLCLT